MYDALCGWLQCLVGLSFVAIVFISIKAIEENSAVESTAFRRGVASFAAPGTIMLINWVIGFTARKLAKWEGHATYGWLTRDAALACASSQ